MAAINAKSASPIRREKTVDICAFNFAGDKKFLIQVSRGRFVEVSHLNEEFTHLDIRPLHELCQNGDHYMASTNRVGSKYTGTIFYIIKDSTVTEVADLQEGDRSRYHCISRRGSRRWHTPITYQLHSDYQKASFYLVQSSLSGISFFIIRSDNTFLTTSDLSFSVSYISSEHICSGTLHEDFKDGLYYFATDYYFYVVKTYPHGLAYCRARSLTHAAEEKVPIYTNSVIAFLQNQDQIFRTNEAQVSGGVASDEMLLRHNDQEDKDDTGVTSSKSSSITLPPSEDAKSEATPQSGSQEDDTGVTSSTSSSITLPPSEDAKSEATPQSGSQEGDTGVTSNMSSYTTLPPAEDGGTVATPQSGSQGAGTMRFETYLKELHEKGLYGKISIKEVLETYVGHTLKQDEVDTAMKKVDIDYSKAVVTSSSNLRDGHPKELVRPRKNISNFGDQEETEDIKITTTITDSVKKWNTKTSGWSVSGTAGVDVTGTAGVAETTAKVSATAKYHRGKTETDIKEDTFEVQMTYSQPYIKKPFSSYEATVFEATTKYTANVQGLKIKFPSDTKLRIKNWAFKKKLSTILEENKITVTEHETGKMTAEIDGKFEALHAKAAVEVFPSSPVLRR